MVTPQLCVSTGLRRLLTQTAHLPPRVVRGEAGPETTMSHGDQPPTELAVGMRVHPSQTRGKSDQWAVWGLGMPGLCPAALTLGRVTLAGPTGIRESKHDMGWELSLPRGRGSPPALPSPGPS